MSLTLTNPLRPALLAAARSERIERTLSRSGVTRSLVTRFVPGAAEDAAMAAVRNLLVGGRAVSVDYLGEDISTPGEAEQTVEAYLSLLAAYRRLALPATDGPRRLEVIKTNLTRHPEPLGMTFKPLYPKGAWIEYSTEPPQPYRQPTKAEECSAWLVSLLGESGATRPQEIVAQAEAEGFSRRTVYRAREILGEQVIDTEGHKHPENRWALTDGEGA